jgi:Uma2 family endonuclease
MPATVITPIKPLTPLRDESWAPAQATLVAGDRLSRPEFERRYEAMPQLKKAELIEGVVYIPSPILIDHGEAQGTILGWLMNYGVATPGVQYAGNASVRLDLDNEVQPDALLRLHTRAGGQSRISRKRFIDGTPELMVEIAISSASYDLHDKLKVYRRNGVQEYLVWRVLDEAIDWFSLTEGEYQPLPASADGIVRSRVFPGLWLAVPALLQGDLAAALAALQDGLRSPEHATFVANLSTPMA